MEVALKKHVNKVHRVRCGHVNETRSGKRSFDTDTTVEIRSNGGKLKNR